MKKSLTIVVRLLLIGVIVLQAFPAIAYQSREVRRAKVTVAIDRRQARTEPIRVPIESPEPFLATGLRWTGGADVVISLRGSTDGRRWTEWLPVERNADLDGDDGSRYSGLILLDSATVYVQLSFDYRGERGDGTESIDISFISPGATGAEAQRRMEQRTEKGIGSEVEQMTSKYPKPPVVTRTEWGCPDGQITTHGDLSYTTVTHLIVHHTVNDNNSTDWPAVVRSIWNFHVFDRGYADIGYNYLVDPNGIVYEGRAGGDNVQGAHFSGVNGGTMGVALLGEFTAVEPTARAISGLRKILAWKCDQRSIDPTGASLHVRSGLDLQHISGHRDGPSATECPGGALYAMLPAIRSQIGAMLTDAGPLAAVSAAGYNTGPLAPDSVAAVFGSGMASTTGVATSVPLPELLDGVSVTLRDAAATEHRCGLFFVSPGQINLLVPPAAAPGAAELIAVNPAGQISSGQLMIASVAPGLFSANANGRGVAAAVILRLKPDGSQTFEPVAVFDQPGNIFVPKPIDFEPESDQLFLILFGTGFRGRSSLSAVSVVIGGTPVETLYAGPTPDFQGLDQLNVRLPRSLAGRGTLDVVVSADGIVGNLIEIESRK